MPTPPVHGPLSPLSQSLAKGAGYNFSFTGEMLSRAPERYVYVFNTSRSNYSLHHPIFGNVTLPGCPPDREYIKCMAIPHPKLEYFSDSDGNLQAKSWDGWRLGVDMLNPANIGMDQYATGVSDLTAGSTNFIQRGVFLSLNETPTAEEMQKSDQVKKDYYHTLIQRADYQEMADVTKLPNEITTEHHIAADYFGMEKSWHKMNRLASMCPNCGDPVRPGTAYHRNSFGEKCIIDREKYAASLAADSEEPQKRGVGRPPKAREDI